MGGKLDRIINAIVAMLALPLSAPFIIFARNTAPKDEYKKKRKVTKHVQRLDQ